MSTRPKDGMSAPPLPLLKNVGAAPLVYFDGVPVFGTYAGNIEVELSARMLMPKPDGSVITDMGCTAHLRCSPQAAQMLVGALQTALAMLEKNQQALGDHDQPNEMRPN